MATNVSDKNRARYLQNATVSVANPSLGNQFSVSFQISGVATGGSPLGVATRVDSIDVIHNPLALDTAADTAAALVAAGQPLYDAAYGAGEYVLDNPAADVFRITRVNGNFLWVEDHVSTDVTQTIAELDGNHFLNAMLHEAQIQGTGRPQRYDDGFEIAASIPTDSRETVVLAHIMLTNATGGAVSARWRLWWFYDIVGWVQDQEVGIRTVTEASGAGVQEDSILVSATGAKKMAVELVDNAGAPPADLGPGSWLNALGVVAN